MEAVEGLIAHSNTYSEVSKTMHECWGYVSDLYSEYVIMTLGTFLVHELGWFAFNLFYLILDDYQLCQQHKINRIIPSEERWRAFWEILRGHFIQLLPVILIGYYPLKFFGFYTGFPLPSMSTFAFQFVIFNIVEDAGFYWVHYYMHTPWAYKKFHYRHHEFTSPYSLAGEIAHPVEFVLNFLLPMLVGPCLCGLFQGCHVVTFWIWMTFRGLRGADSHSGYDLPYHPLRLISFIYDGPVAHDFWDWLMGTDKKWKAYEKQYNIRRLEKLKGIK